MAPPEPGKSTEELGRELLAGPQYVNNVVPLLAKVRHCLKVSSGELQVGGERAHQNLVYAME